MKDLTLKRFDPLKTLPEDGERVLVCADDNGESYFWTAHFTAEYEEWDVDEIVAKYPAFEVDWGRTRISEVKFWCRLPGDV